MEVSFIAQTDNSLGQAGAVVGLNAAGADDGVAHPLGQHLLLPRGATGAGAGSAGAPGICGRAPMKPNSMTTGPGPLR